MLRIVYAGSPEISSVPLKNLLESDEVEVVAVLTNPPKSQGRKSEPIPTPVETVARNAKKVPVILTPERLDSEVRSKLESLKPDLLVCFAYGKIFGPKFLSLFPKGGINLHPSLLPLYRGCAPVPAAILNMDKFTGFTVQTLGAEMDSGDILVQTKFELKDDDNSETILNRAAAEGSLLFLEAIRQIESGTAKPVKQDSSKATYCTMLKKEDGLIDWNQSAQQIDAKIRAFYPWPGAFTTVKENSLKIHRAQVYKGAYKQDNKATEPGTVLGVEKCGILVQTGDGILAIQNLQWQTKKAMEFKDFLNGSKDFTSCICGK